MADRNQNPGRDRPYSAGPFPPESSLVGQVGGQIGAFDCAPTTAPSLSGSVNQARDTVQSLVTCANKLEYAVLILSGDKDNVPLNSAEIPDTERAGASLRDLAITLSDGDTVTKRLFNLVERLERLL